MNTIWVLILFAHVGVMGEGNSNALTTQEFTTKQRCEKAGYEAKRLAGSTVKHIEYSCVEK